MIEVNDLTMTYTSGKGIYDLNFVVKQGQVVGYLGPNGAGKTTTIRALLGFMNPNKGAAKIDGMDCWKGAPKIQKRLGYIPGEITFLDGMSGEEFLRFMHNMRKIKTKFRQKQLLDMFELNPKGKIKRFSKGMKQKLGIVTAFMHDPDVLILDEPTSGLDPLMQNRFTQLIISEKAKGKTILMSSHMFEEVEKTCDSVLIIKEGRIVKQSDVQTLKATERKRFIIKTNDTERLVQALKIMNYEIGNLTKDNIEVYVTGHDINQFIKIISQYTILNIDLKLQTLDDIFMQYYSKEEK